MVHAVQLPILEGSLWIGSKPPSGIRHFPRLTERFLYSRSDWIGGAESHGCGTVTPLVIRSTSSLPPVPIFATPLLHTTPYDVELPPRLRDPSPAVAKLRRPGGGQCSHQTISLAAQPDALGDSGELLIPARRTLTNTRHRSAIHAAAVGSSSASVTES